ncbi:AAA domain-containing protein [Xylaria curta]|nr:AAA domain-containing protein [Xylaria curta]
MPRPDVVHDDFKVVEARVTLPGHDHITQNVGDWEIIDQTDEPAGIVDLVIVVVTDGKRTVTFKGPNNYFLGPKQICHAYLNIAWNLSPDEKIYLHECVFRSTSREPLALQFFGLDEDGKYQLPANLGAIDVAIINKALKGGIVQQNVQGIRILRQLWADRYAKLPHPNVDNSNPLIEVDHDVRTTFTYNGSPVRPIIKDNVVNWAYINPVHPKFPCEKCRGIDHDYTTCPQRTGDGPCFFCHDPGHHEEKCPVPKHVICTVCRQRDDHTESRCPHLLIPPKGDLNDPLPVSAQVQASDQPWDDEDTDEDKSNAHRTYVSATMPCFLTYSTLPGQVGRAELKRKAFRPVLPYDVSYAAAVGAKHTQGYRHTIEVDNARFSTREIHIRHSYLMGSTGSYKTFADTCFLYSAILEKPRFTDFDKEKVRKWLHNRGYTELPETPLYDILVITIIMDVSSATNGIRHMHRDDVIAQLKDTLGANFTLHLSRVDQLMTNSDAPRKFEIALACHDGQVEQVSGIFFEGWERRDMFPYTKLMRNAKNGEFGSFNRLIPYQDAKFERQEHPQVFMSPKERSVRLSYATTYEYKYQEGLSELSSRRPLPALAIPVRDMSDHGYPTAWILIVKDLHSLAIIPRPDEMCKIEFVDIDYDLPKLPKAKVDQGEAIDRIVKSILKAYHTGRDLSQGKHSHVVAYMAQHLESIVVPAPPGYEVARANFIEQHAEFFVPRHSGSEQENIFDYEARLKKKITSQWKYGTFVVPTKAVGNAPQCTAFCRRLGKEWEHIASVCFVVFAPIHPFWNRAWGPGKPVHFKIPNLGINEKLSGQRFLSLIAKKLNYPNLSVLVNTAVHEDTAKAEMKAIAEATVSESAKDNFSLFHLWITEFNQKHVRYRDFEIFPAIAHLADRLAGKPAPECRHFTPTPVSVTAEAFTSDDTGDGKTDKNKHNPPAPTSAQSQTDTPTSAKPESAEPNNDDVSTERGVKHDTSSARYVTRFDDQASNCPPRGFTQEESDFILAEYLKLNNEQRDIIMQDARQRPHGTVVVCGCPGGGKSTTVIFFAFLLQWSSVDPALLAWTEAATEKPTENTDEPPRRIQTVVVGANNEQLNDIAAQFHKHWSRLDPKRKPKVIRASIVSTAAGRAFREPDEEYLPGDFATMLEPERLLADLTKGAIDKSREGATIWKSPESIESAVNKYITQNKNSPLVKQMLSNLSIRKSDPALWEKESKKTHKQLSEQLIKFLYAEADVIVCTPLVASTIGSIIKAQVLIVDEERRMTEPSTLIPLTQFKDVIVRIFSGDSKQLKPLVFSADSHHYKGEAHFLNPFARQLELPLGTRMERCGALRVHRLRINYRAKGYVSRFASDEFYDGYMEEAPHEYDDPVILRMRDFLRKITHDIAGGSSVLLNVKGDWNERAEGHSIINRHNAECIQDLVVMAHEARLCDADGKRFSIGIVTPYKAQATLISSKIKELSKAEVCHELIDVRTAQGMQGNEHDLVIIDLVRSENLGFIKQPDLGAVMTSRAKYGSIAVGNTVVWAKSGRRGPSSKWLTNFETYHLDRAAIKSFHEHTWGRQCSTCHRTHSKDQPDCGALVCINCKGSHHVRNCTRAIATPIQLTVDPSNRPEFKGWHSYVKKEN